MSNEIEVEEAVEALFALLLDIRVEPEALEFELDELEPEPELFEAELEESTSTLASAMTSMASSGLDFRPPLPFLPGKQ